MKSQQKSFVHFSIFWVFLAVALVLSGCNGLNVHFRNKTYNLMEPTAIKEAQVDSSKKAVNIDEMNGELIAGLKEAISAMEKWDDFTPERRQSIIDSLKGLVVKREGDLGTE